MILDETRKNKHTFDSYEEEVEAYIENQKRVYGDVRYGEGDFPYFVEAYLINYE